MIDQLTTSPAFGILLTIFAYQIGLKIKNKTNHILANPLLIAVGLIIVFLLVLKIPYTAYKVGGDGIHFFLGPLTVVLGLMLYRQRLIIKAHLLSLVIGITSGVLTSFFSIFILGKIMGLDDSLLVSLLPKSITTPMALSLTEILEGIPVITVVTVTITGTSGALLAPLVLKLLPHFNPIAVGVGIGTSAHAVGTSKALEIGETEGALSSAAIGLAGLITVLIVPPLYALLNHLID